MKVRFGFVAMSLSLVNASPSKTMTAKYFSSLSDREAALRRLTRIAAENLHNSLRIMRHAVASGVHLYRFSSKLIPLFGHELTEGWDFIHQLHDDFAACGKFIRTHNLRVSLHPEHYLVLNSPKELVLRNSIADLDRHVQMFTAMSMDERAKLVIHTGGAYKDKESAMRRFVTNWTTVPEPIRKRITLENDDRTFTARDTLHLSQTIGIPMVLDLHHHRCNHEDGSTLGDIVQPVFASWQGSGLPPKIHVSSRRSNTDFRAHANDVDPDDLLAFLDQARELNQDVDVMIEAKNKDEALFTLMKKLSLLSSVKVLDGGSILYRP